MACSSSPDSQARHLLRNLSDLRELHRNELGTAFLRARPAHETEVERLNALFEWVRSAAQSIGSSDDRKGCLQSEILRRCDLSAEAHASVAAALGLSRRAFYYERRKALVRLAMLLSASVQVAVTTAQAPLDPFELRLAAARAFESGGHVELALRDGLDLLRVAETHEQCVRAWAVVLESHVLCGALDAACVSLRALETAAAALDAQSPQSTAALIESATASAVAHWNLGDAARAFECLDRARRVVRRTPDLRERRCIADAWSRALLLAADFSTIAGFGSSALAAVREASALVTYLQDPPADLRAQVLVTEALVVLTLDRPLVQAETLARAALSIAQRHGLSSHAVEVATLLCLIQAVARNHRSALETGSAGLALARQLEAHQVGVFLRLTIARIYAAHGNVAASSELLAEASRSIPEGSSLHAVRDAAAASIALSAGAPLEALMYARDAAKAAGRYGFGRISGASLALQAQALDALGQPRAAAAAADAAVAVLERGSTRYTLAEAYALSARLTRNGRHQRLASELRSVLSAPA